MACRPVDSSGQRRGCDDVTQNPAAGYAIVRLELTGLIRRLSDDDGSIAARRAVSVRSYKTLRRTVDPVRAWEPAELVGYDGPRAANLISTSQPAVSPTKAAPSKASFLPPFFPIPLSHPFRTTPTLQHTNTYRHIPFTTTTTTHNEVYYQRPQRCRLGPCCYRSHGCSCQPIRPRC